MKKTIETKNEQDPAQPSDIKNAIDEMTAKAQEQAEAAEAAVAAGNKQKTD